MKCLVTGAAGFIGSELSRRLLARGDSVVGIDNLNDYYSVALKKARLDRLTPESEFCFIPLDLNDRSGMQKLFEKHAFDAVINLAAQAGVRYSLENPLSYVDSNLTGFAHVLEGCRQQSVKHLLFASSSSVYGSNTTLPFSVEQPVNHPLSLYAASKKANELMAHSYSHLYQLPVTGLRFFTVYGPWGRPDMALFKFTQKILAGEPIPIYNHGHHQRDFTYIDDIVEAVVKLIDQPAQADTKWCSDQPSPASSLAPYRVYNIGNGKPQSLMHYIEVLETCLGKKAIKEFYPLQAGDVADTHADVSELIRDIHYCPKTSIETGIQRFVEWYKGYHQLG